VIDHEDLDRVAAEALVSAAVGAVVNASPSISGRYPNLGPLILAEAGVPLVDTVGPLLLDKVREGDRIRVEGDRIYVDDRLVAVGMRQSGDSILRAMESAKGSLGERFESFARNTLEYMNEERDLLFGGAGLPELQHDLEGRPVLVVVRGYDYRQDLAALKTYLREVRPFLIGVDGGADALLEAGWKPDLVFGDMDSVSPEGLRLAGRVLVHAYPDGEAPGLGRVEAAGVEGAETLPVPGLSEDVAILIAEQCGAELIVAVGTHVGLVEFLDKGRKGASSTFLTRLKVGARLVDAKGVSKLYPSRVSVWQLVALVVAGLVAVSAIVHSSNSLADIFQILAIKLRLLLGI
jgi:uncharacterized membrane-anchored protein